MNSNVDLITDLLKHYSSILSFSNEDVFSEQSISEIENCLLAIKDLVYSHLPFPSLTFLLHVIEQVNNHLHLFQTIPIQNQDLALQTYWLKILTNAPETSFPSPSETEIMINDCIKYMIEDFDGKRAFSCYLISTLCKNLNPYSKRISDQIFITVKNLRASLIDSIKQEKRLSQVACVFSIVEITRFWSSHLPKHLQSNSLFPELSLQSLFQIFSLKVDSNEPLSNSGDKRIPISPFLSHVVSEGIITLIQIKEIWNLLSTNATQEILLRSMMIIKSNQPNTNTNTNNEKKNNTAATLILKGFLSEHVFDTILSLPNFISDLMSHLLSILSVGVTQEAQNKKLQLLELRGTALQLIFKFLSLEDCQLSKTCLNDMKSLEWELILNPLYNIEGKDSIEQSKILSFLVVSAFSGYIQTYNVTSQVKPIVTM